MAVNGRCRFSFRTFFFLSQKREQEFSKTLSKTIRKSIYFYKFQKNYLKKNLFKKIFPQFTERKKNVPPNFILIMQYLHHSFRLKYTEYCKFRFFSKMEDRNDNCHNYCAIVYLGMLCADALSNALQHRALVFAFLMQNKRWFLEGTLGESRSLLLGTKITMAKPALKPLELNEDIFFRKVEKKCSIGIFWTFSVTCKRIFWNHLCFNCSFWNTWTSFCVQISITNHH